MTDTRQAEHQLPLQADADELQRAAAGTRAASPDGGLRAAVANASKAASRQILFDPVRTVEMFLLQPVQDG